MAQKILTHQFLLSVTAACIVGFLSESYRPAHAETQEFVIDIPVYGQTVQSEVYSDLISQAELRVGTVINRQFSQNADLSSIQVVVMGARNGEIIPILTTTVSRTQWQENPQVTAWTRYYNASYALFQRHEVREAETPASAPVKSTTRNFRDQSRIDEAFDSGGLTRQAAQEHLSDLD